jgi:arabinoxylan arabinofuranohydrolase
VLEIEATATTRCVVGKVVVAVKVTNEDHVPLNLVVTSPFGTKEFAGVAPGKTVSAAFSTRQASVPAGAATIGVSPAAGGAGAHEAEAAYAATVCH